MWEQNTFLYETNIRTAWDQELFYSKLYPLNTTVEWIDTDKPEDAIYKKDIKYTFNEYGFRSDSFEERSDINILTCGCSHTVGVGVNQQEAWPFMLKKLIQKHTGKTVKVWNLATSGASPDYVVRSVFKTIDILNPDYVCIFWPPITRLETPDSLLHSIVNQNFIKNKDFPKQFVNGMWLQDYLFTKNDEFLKSFCKSNNVHLVTNTVNKSVVENIERDYFPADSSGRDGLHPGPEWHKTGAEFYFNNIKEFL